MSGLVKAVKKVFKKILKSPIFKAIAIAAVVWFTAGTAMAYFAAPSAGLGSAMATSATTMWTTTTSFFGAEAAATAAGNGFGGGAVGAMAQGGGAAANAAYAAQASQSLLAGTEMAAAEGLASGASLSAEIGGVVAPAAETAGAFTGLTPTLSGAAAPLDLTLMGNAAAGTTGSGVAAGTTLAKTGMMGWLADNPMATMMLGQGVMGAASGYAADKENTRQSEIEAKRLQDRGLMGFDHLGNRGIVNSQTTAEAVAEPVVQAAAPQQVLAPTVAQQEVATPPPPQVPVPREQLPQLNKSGQLV